MFFVFQPAEAPEPASQPSTVRNPRQAHPGHMMQDAQDDDGNDVYDDDDDDDDGVDDDHPVSISTGSKL